MKTATIRERLQEAEETLDAIRTGRVDALVVSGQRGQRTLTVDGSAHPYFVLLDAMGDGGAILDARGDILFGNRGLAQITRSRKLRGSAFQRLIVPAQRLQFEQLLGATARRSARREFLLDVGTSSPTPVMIAMSPLPLDSAAPAARKNRVARMAIVTDLSSSKRAEAAQTGLLERLIAAEDDERRRIARELHDESGQALTALLVGLRAMTDQSLPRPARSVALRLRRIARQTMGDIGRVARGLHPAILDDSGLATAARRYVQDYGHSLGIAVKFSARNVDSAMLSPLVAATAYRILQEAMANVARHARATSIRVDLRRARSWLEVRVTDNGVGFDTKPDSGIPRLGLHGMRERATLLGGAIEIESRRGQGTAVHARIPAPKHPANGAGRATRRTRSVAAR